MVPHTERLLGGYVLRRQRGGHVQPCDQCLQDPGYGRLENRGFPYSSLTQSRTFALLPGYNTIALPIVRQ